MKHENKATEYMVETRAGRLNFAIATVIGLLTLASGLLGPAQSSTAAEKPSEGQAPAQERIVIDPSQIEDQKGLSARAQSGQSTEPIKAETTCSKDPDGASICVTLGEQEESGLKPHAALPLPKNLCKSGVRSSDRTNGCVGVPLTIKHHSGKGAVLGTLTGTAYVYQYSATNQTRIGNQLTLVTSKTSGTGNQFSIVGNTPKCSGSCSRTGALTSLAGKALKAGKTLSAESYYNWTGRSARTNQSLSWNLTIKHPRVAQVLPFNYAGASPVRCDREYKSISAGCIMTKGQVAIGYDRASHPNFAKHVTDAQKSGLPGKSTALKRLKPGQSSAKNRSKACPSRLKRPSGYSCDEYPFASTQQGAYYGGGTGRTFSQCKISDKAYPVGAKGGKGYSACMIPQKENSAAGSELSKFFKESRVLTGDSFFVQIL